jgi:hypothetical protein
MKMSVFSDIERIKPIPCKRAVLKCGDCAKGKTQLMLILMVIRKMFPAVD